MEREVSLTLSWQGRQRCSHSGSKLLVSDANRHDFSQFCSDVLGTLQLQDSVEVRAFLKLAVPEKLVSPRHLSHVSAQPQSCFLRHATLWFSMLVCVC